MFRGWRPNTELVLTVVNAVDAADMALLPGIFRVLEMDWGVSPTLVAQMVFVQTVIKSVATVAWGFVSDRVSKKMLLSRSCLVWGLLTVLVAASASFQQLATLRVASVGVLAVMMPLSQGILSDIVQPNRRGGAFGRLGFWSNIGSMVGGSLSTAIAAMLLVGVRGWRMAFMAVGAVSLLLVPVVDHFVTEPQQRDKEGLQGGSKHRLSIKETAGVIARKPTFGLLVLQGLFGEMPWVAFGTFSTLFFQYAGLSDAAVASLFVIQSIGGAAGTLFGGWAGDAAAAWWPSGGRVMIAQLTVLLGIPFMWVILEAIPRSAASYHLYAIALFGFSFCAVWTPAATNRPILCEICPADMRASILGAWVGLETLGSAFVSPVVAYLAQQVFGYQPSPLAISAMAEQERARNASALGSALFYTMITPWVPCLLVYSMMHWTYQPDRDAYVASLQEREGEALLEDRGDATAVPGSL